MKKKENQDLKIKLNEKQLSISWKISNNKNKMIIWNASTTLSWSETELTQGSTSWALQQRGSAEVLASFLFQCL
jgi:hypothetical protein